MTSFINIYGLILICGIICALIDRYVFRKEKDFTVLWLVYAVENYILISVARTVMGNGKEQLSYSFYDKGGRAYVKVFVLLMAFYVANGALHYLIKKYDEFEMRLIGCYVFLEAIRIVFIGNLTMHVTCVLLCLSFVGAIVSIMFFKKDSISTDSMREGMSCIIIQIIAFCVQHLISGPTELYAYNSSEFIYDYRTLCMHLLVGSILISVLLSILMYKLVPQRLCVILMWLIAIYNIGGYLQYFVLNGNMNVIDGSRAEWDNLKVILNILVWVTIAALVFALSFKVKKGIRWITLLTVYVILVQLAATVYTMLTTDVMDNKTEQVVMDNSIEVSEDNNVVLFILDAYDTQEIEMVISDEPDFLSPLSDFTYYNNMTSRYYYTDFSLPFFLTGGGSNLDISDKSEAYGWYNDSTFLQRIAQYDYRINALTDKKYVDKFKSANPIANYTKDNYCILDTERTLEAFSKSIRFRNMPFIMKNLFEYNMIDFMNIIVDTNIYKFGRDDIFYNIIDESGVDTNNCKGTLSIYHLYGAHAPYYMNENCEVDYNGTKPLEQFKGSLNVVYRYIDILKEKGVYDEATIIITADHGLNPGQIEALKAAGVNCDENSSNPIFFIKQKNESHDNMQVENKRITHDMLFDTIMTCIDPKWKDAYYGTIWD